MVQKLCTTNVVQNVVQTKVDWVLKQSLRMNIRKKNLCLKNWGPGGAKNRKLTSNISKLEYFEAFWLKIQKLKIFRKKPKNRGPGIKKMKINTKYLKTRVLQSFLDENPKFENF